MSFAVADNVAQVPISGIPIARARSCTWPTATSDAVISSNEALKGLLKSPDPELELVFSEKLIAPFKDVIPRDVDNGPGLRLRPRLIFPVPDVPKRDPVFPERSSVPLDQFDPKDVGKADGLKLLFPILDVPKRDPELPERSSVPLDQFTPKDVGKAVGLKLLFPMLDVPKRDAVLPEKSSVPLPQFAPEDVGKRPVLKLVLPVPDEIGRAHV